MRFDDRNLQALLARCERETGGKVGRWELVFHVNGPGGKSSGAVTLRVCWSAPGVVGKYWNHLIQEADHA